MSFEYNNKIFSQQMEDGAIEIIEPYVEEDEKPKAKKAVGESILKKSNIVFGVIFFLKMIN